MTGGVLSQDDLGVRVAWRLQLITLHELIWFDRDPQLVSYHKTVTLPLVSLILER